MKSFDTLIAKKEAKELINNQLQSPLFYRILKYG
jgi:hypothetical protein